MKKLGILVALAAALFVAACGTNQQPVSSGSSSSHQTTKATPTPPPAKNTVTVGTPVFAGELPRNGSFNPNPSGGVTLTNNSKTDAAQSIVMQWTAYNAAGAVITSEPGTIGILQPQQTLYVTTLFVGADPSTIAKVTVIALPNSWLPASEPKGAVTGQNISIAQTSPSYDPNQYAVSAELSSGWRENLESVPAWAYCTDSTGKYVGGDYSYVNLIPAGGTGVGSVSFTINAAAAPATCQVDAQPVMVPQGS